CYHPQPASPMDLQPFAEPDKRRATARLRGGMEPLSRKLAACRSRFEWATAGPHAASEPLASGSGVLLCGVGLRVVGWLGCRAPPGPEQGQAGEAGDGAQQQGGADSQ